MKKERAKTLISVLMSTLGCNCLMVYTHLCLLNFNTNIVHRVNMFIGSTLYVHH